MDEDGGRLERRMTESEIRALARNARTVSSIERMARGLERSPGALDSRHADAALEHLREAAKEIRAGMAAKAGNPDGNVA